MKLQLSLILLLCLVRGASASTKMAWDAFLEERLVVERVYKLENAQTFPELASLLYGHSTWWPKLSKKNPKLFSKYGESRPLPVGTPVRYKAPDIPDHYKTQPDDTLVRISIWKYGTKKYWKPIFEHNRAVLKNANHMDFGIPIDLPSPKTLSTLMKPAVKGFDKAVPDPALERALKIERRYEIQTGDHLAKIARLFYGHETWAIKLKERNPQFKVSSPDEPLIEGMWLVGLIPELGDQYRVRAGDTLSRIAFWKYGSASEWPTLYERNSDRINAPDLIKPGDLLYFDEKGNIKLAESQSVLVTGLEAPLSSSEQGSERALNSVPEFSEPPVQKFFNSQLREHGIYFAVSAGALFVFLAVWILYSRRPYPRGSRSHQLHTSKVAEYREMGHESHSGMDDTGPIHAYLPKKWWKNYLRPWKKR